MPGATRNSQGTLQLLRKGLCYKLRYQPQSTYVTDPPYTLLVTLAESMHLYHCARIFLNFDDKVDGTNSLTSWCRPSLRPILPFPLRGTKYFGTSIFRKPL